MPFTGSYPAAVLPFTRTALPLPALVIGSMVPDLPFYLPVPYGRKLSHHPLGVVTVNLAAGLLLHEAWLRVLGPAVRDYTPSPIARHVTLARADAARVVAALGVGATTHILWDAFTHGDVWGVRLVPALTARVGPLPAYEWAQYASGLLGAAAITWHTWRRRPPTPPPAASSAVSPSASSAASPAASHASPPIASPSASPAASHASPPIASPTTSPASEVRPTAERPATRRVVVSAVAAVAAVAGGAAGFCFGLRRPDPVREAFYYGATWAVDAGVIALVGSAGLHRLVTRHARWSRHTDSRHADSRHTNSGDADSRHTDPRHADPGHNRPGRPHPGQPDPRHHRPAVR